MLASCAKDDCVVQNTESEVLIHNILQTSYLNYYEADTFVETFTNPDTIRGEDSKYSITWELEDTILNTRIVGDAFSFVSTAYACTPSISGYTLLNKVDSFSIRTIYDLDSLHSAGDEVDDLFTINGHTVQSFNASIANLMEYDHWNYQHLLIFAMHNEPYYEGKMQIEITMYLEDGTQWIEKSKEVIRLNN